MARKRLHSTEPGTSDHEAAEAAVRAAEVVYASTPKGAATLAGEARTAPGERVSALRKILVEGEETRIANQQNGLRTQTFLAYARAAGDLDEEQALAVFRKCWDRASETRGPTSRAWAALIDAQDEALLGNKSLDEVQFIDLHDRFRSLREVPPPDGRTFAAIKELPGRVTKARRALDRQTRSAAGLRGVGEAEVAERFAAFRLQYRDEYALRDPDDRPTPPEEWLRGVRSVDMMAVSIPHDPATEWALYRCQSDPEAFEENPDARWASVDLETAGPEGKAGMEPENGSIIEIGIVECDSSGAEVSRYSQMVRPSADALATYGTGAVAVHHITPDDVAQAPTWDEVAPATSQRLGGRVQVAQNFMFERAWLSHHLTAAGQPYTPWGPTVDTLCVARQYLPGLASHRLQNLCEATGIAYTDGHRATHDAEVTAKVFFALRTRITATWVADRRNQGLAQPPVGAGRRVGRLERTKGPLGEPWTAMADRLARRRGTVSAA